MRHLHDASWFFALAFALALVAACGGGRPTTPETADVIDTASAPRAHDQPGNLCPVHLPGVQVSFADVADGPAVTFTAPPDHVDHLRARVHQLSMDHRRYIHLHPRSAELASSDRAGRAAPTHPAGETGDRLVSATPLVENIEHGARLIMRPSNPADLELVREHVRRHAAALARGDCTAEPTAIGG